MMAKSQNSILIVDDEENLRVSLTDQLRDEGYNVSGAANSQEALALLKNSPFQLVILDLKFPEGMTGHEMLKFMKSTYPGMKVLVLTAYANLKEGKTAKQAGADDFLSKPYNVEDLIQLVGNMLSY